jgi:hypothetical protein
MTVFAKKPAPATPASTQPAPAPGSKLAGWPMLALTPDYGLMGYLAPLDAPLLGWLNIANQQTVLLTQCQMQALSSQSLAAESAPEVILPKTMLVALMPRDEAGQRSALLQLPPQGHRAALTAGPFLIRAALRVPGDIPLRNLYNTASGLMVAVTDAEIHCQLPGTKFPDVKASVLLVNKALVQFYHPL